MRFKSIIVGIFFGLLIVVGLAIYKDYGIPWDEPLQRKLGLHTYEYVLGQNEKLLKNSDRFYGQHPEFLLVWLENVFSITDIQQVYHVRHLANYLFFVVGVFFFFLLLHKRLRSVWWALLGSGFLVLSPRIFAHSFYNSKDLVFLPLFIIAAYVAIIFMEKKTVKWAVLSALTGALLIGVRVLGVILPFLLVDLFFLNGRHKKDTRLLVLYFSLLAILVVAFWPILWTAPIAHFIEGFKYFPQKTGNLFFGIAMNSHEVPWNYTLGWMLVTIPLAYLALFFLGIGHFIKKIPQVLREDLLMLGWFVIPLVMTIVLKSVLHDAWRHMFFIYPPLLYFSTMGLAKASPKIKRGLLVILALNLLAVVSFMVNNHPHQNMYFNELVRPPYGEKFTLDYWGLSYKQGYEYIAQTDQRSSIKVWADDFPGETNLLMLPKEDRERFQFIKSRDGADYYLSTYRGLRDLYYEPAYFEIVINETRILGVHKLAE